MESLERPKIIRFIYDDYMAKRVDQFVVENLEDYSRSIIQKWIKGGYVSVNGEVVKANHKVKNNDEVRVKIPPPRPAEPVPQNIPLNIVYQDSDLMVINKQAGLVVHPAPGSPDNTLVNALLYYMKDLSGIGGILRPGIVHRLDRDTTGLMIIAKNDTSHRILSEMIKFRRVKRVYQAVIWGVPEENHGFIEGPIGRHPTTRFRWAINENNGRHARTYYETIEVFRFFSLLRLTLETGRTHQIRVHLHSKGHPVLGDQMYKRKLSTQQLEPIKREMPKVFSGIQSISRQLLHSTELYFNHPITEQPLAFTCPPPDDFKTILNLMRSSLK